MDKLKAMTLFVDIVREGSLSAAGTLNELSATMVGNHLRNLEANLGLKLLHRTTRRQHLTDFGQHYYERCLDILSLVEDAESLALESRAHPTGTLRLTAPYAFGVDWLMPALADYTARHPDVDLDVVIADRPMGLIDDGFEAAFRIGTLADSTLIARPLAAHRLICCASADYVAQRGQPASPNELPQHDCLVYTFSSGIDAVSPRAAWTFTDRQGESIQVPVVGRIHANSPAALHRAVRAGMGIAQLPEAVVSDDIENGRLIPVLSAHEAQPRPLHLLYLRDRRISPKLRSFIEFAMERFGPARLE